MLPKPQFDLFLTLHITSAVDLSKRVIGAFFVIFLTMFKLHLDLGLVCDQDNRMQFALKKEEMHSREMFESV